MPWGVPGCENVEFNEWLGNFQLGDMLPLHLFTIDKHSQASTPTACPTYQIFDSSGQEVVAVTKLPIQDRYRFDSSGADFNYFAHSIRIDTSYSTGHYFVLFRYIIGGVTYCVTRTFYVNSSGGDADGRVLSLARVSRPEADYIAYQPQSGSMKVGRNPH